MINLLQKTILIMSFSTFFTVAFLMDSWQKTVFYTLCYATVSFFFVCLEEKAHGQKFDEESRKREERIINKMGIKKYIYGGAVMSFVLPTVIDEIIVLSLVTMMVLYVGVLMSYVAFVMYTLYRFEEKVIQEVKEDIKETLVVKHSQPVLKSDLETKKEEVFVMLERAAEKINEMNMFGSIEKRLLFSEVYKEGIERKLSILSSMSEEQRSKETPRVAKYMDEVLKEAEKFVG